jgi:hypothetical protein
MSSIVTSKFRIHNAEQFVEAFDEAANSVIYLSIGKNTSFPNDNVPPVPINSTANIEFSPWRDMFGVKRVTPSDVSHVVPRYNWTSGTVYTQYDDQATNILDDSFYVITDEFNVYKCLSNGGGASSTSKPTGKGTVEFKLPDNYIWKYMYTVSTSKALKFLTNDYLPVQTLDSDDGTDQWSVQQNAIDGGIHFITVTSGGSGYTSAPNVAIIGDGTGATANATVVSNTVTSIDILTPGTGYTTASVVVSGGGASADATARAIISPKNGHGSDATEELGGKFVMLNVRLDGNEANTISTANEFRQVSLVRDPYLYGTSDRAFALLYRQTYKYTVSGVSGTFTLDEEVQDAGSNSAFVVEWKSATSELFTTVPLNLEFANGAFLTGQSSGATATIAAIDTPGLEPYTGDLLYIENRVPIARSDDQIEDVKLVIQF